MERQQSTSRSHRGFAAMDQAKQREIASKGGKAAHLKGTAHEFTPDEAKMAGQKGGQASHSSRTNQLRSGVRERRRMQQPPANSPQTEEQEKDVVNSFDESSGGLLSQSEVRKVSNP